MPANVYARYTSSAISTKQTDSSQSLFVYQGMGVWGRIKVGSGVMGVGYNGTLLDLVSLFQIQNTLLSVAMIKIKRKFDFTRTSSATLYNEVKLIYTH